MREGESEIRTEKHINERRIRLFKWKKQVKMRKELNKGYVRKGRPWWPRGGTEVDTKIQAAPQQMEDSLTVLSWGRAQRQGKEKVTQRAPLLFDCLDNHPITWYLDSCFKVAPDGLVTGRSAQQDSHKFNEALQICGGCEMAHYKVRRCI